MTAFTGLARASASLTQLHLKDPQRFQAASLLELAEVARQQAITNDILAVNTRIAYENSHLLKGVLDAVAQLNEANQRERTLKELLYQMTKLLKADQRGEADPVELAFRARVFLHTLASHRLSTHDLANLDEKALFDKLSATAQGLLKGNAYKQLEAFEAVYAMFGVAEKEDPCRDIKYVFPPHEPKLVVPPPPEGTKFPEPEPPLTVESEIKSTKTAAMATAVVMAIFFAGCASTYAQNKYASLGGMFLWGLGIIVTVFGGLVFPSQEAKDPKKLAEMRENLKQRRNKWAAAKQKWDKKQEPVLAAHQAQVQRAQEAYEAQKEKYLEKMEEYKRLEDARQQKKRVAVERHKSLLTQMRSQINSFLEQHSGLQEFLPKV